MENPKPIVPVQVRHEDRAKGTHAGDYTVPEAEQLMQHIDEWGVYFDADLHDAMMQTSGQFRVTREGFTFEIIAHRNDD